MVSGIANGLDEVNPVQDTTTAWFALAGALGGVLVTSIVALTTAFLNRRWQREAAGEEVVRERARELRKERRAVYGTCWAGTNRWSAQMLELKGLVAETATAPPIAVTPEIQAKLRTVDALEWEWRQGLAGVYLIAGDEVLERVTEHADKLQLLLQAAREGQWPGTEKWLQQAHHQLLDAMRVETVAPEGS
jgi:hypothetical protein